MSLFIEQANLCIPTTKTTEMIEISIIFIILLILIWKKSIGSLRPIPIPIPKKRPSPILADTDTSAHHYSSSTLCILVWCKVKLPLFLHTLPHRSYIHTRSTSPHHVPLNQLPPLHVIRTLPHYILPTLPVSCQHLHICPVYPCFPSSKSGPAANNPT